MVFRFTPEAEAELTAARRWYAHQRQDLDIEFMQCIDDTLRRVVVNPRMFPVMYRNLRRAVVHRFPFVVFYKVAMDEIQVIAIFHSRRDPKRLKSRIG